MRPRSLVRAPIGDPQLKLESVGALPALTVLFLVSACGAASYNDRLMGSIAVWRDTVNHFNSATPRDVRGTGDACAAAARSLENNGPPTEQAPSNLRALAQSFHQAFALALQGFRDCESAARQQDYVGMARADEELARANLFLAVAVLAKH